MKKVLCSLCDKPILTTGTSFNNEPCHIACFNIANKREIVPKESDEQSLMPCPFCGSVELNIDSYPSPDKTVTWHRVLHGPCNPCSMSMLDSDKAHLIDRWNTRQTELEYILCASTWYKDLELKNEEGLRLRGSSPYNVDRGIVFSGWRHAQCLYQKMALTGLRDAESGEFVQGFLTNKNRFVNRKEAYRIAYKANQIIGPNKGRKWNCIGLTSEDIY